MELLRGTKAPKVSDLGLVPYNIPTTTTTTSDPEIGGRAKEQLSFGWSCGFCFGDVLKGYVVRGVGV